MKNNLSRIETIKRQFAIPKKEHFVAAPSGTNYKVFLSENYVIRFRDDNPELLLREAKFLKQLDQTLIPKVLWSGKINQSFFMVENRLTGQPINSIWKNLSAHNKKNIIDHVIKFLLYQRTKTKNHVYSVKTGKRYKNFFNYLTDGIKQKTANIKKFKQTNEMMEDLFSIINDPVVKSLFTTKTRTFLVHGDLIIHNLLTDGKNLTGVLDWELALWGDPDYDISRLFYYQECARAYQTQGIDKTFESDYMNKLIAAILKSGLIKNKKTFQKKYQFVRAIYFLNALYWATNSNNPPKNLNELIEQWNKNRG